MRILFPGAGLLVCSAWCLGILNSHRKFFLSYTAPVIWNVAMIATMLAFRGTATCTTLAIYLAWGSVVGSALQFVVQLPVVLQSDATSCGCASTRSAANVREVLRNFAAGIRQPRAWCRSAPTWTRCWPASSARARWPR